MASVAQFIVFGPFFSAGELVTAPKLYHYTAGTLTLKDVWTDRAKGSTAAQPVVGDAEGLVTCYADGLYKFVVRDSAGNTLYTWDNASVLEIAGDTPDDVFRVVGSVDATKKIAFETDGATTGTTLTIANQQTTSKTLSVPNLTANDTVATVGLAQTVTGVKTMTNMTTAAGTTAVPSLTVTAGTNLTSAAAGAVENDGVGMYHTTNTTDGRAHVPARQHVKLTANGSAISTIANVFGTTSNISLVASAFYYIEIVLFLSKSTSSTTVITLTNSAAPTSQNVEWVQSPITGLVAPPGTATALLGQTQGDTTAALAITTGSLSTGATHYIKITIQLENGTGTSLKIQGTATAGTLTPLRGSYWTAVRIPTGNTGTFSA